MKAEVCKNCVRDCQELHYKIWPICFVLLHTSLLVM
jgi:hypothetical protein